MKENENLGALGKYSKPGLISLASRYGVGDNCSSGAEAVDRGGCTAGEVADMEQCISTGGSADFDCSGGGEAGRLACEPTGAEGGCNGGSDACLGCGTGPFPDF
ncbi:MAG: hypothetical protein HQ596_04945 [Candidatus Saganbacteria bacterium]|nr:hypothetical protein [Candidatus Saganbacteria bacterium]